MHGGVTHDFISYVLHQENVALFSSAIQPLGFIGGILGNVLLYRYKQMSVQSSDVIAVGLNVLGSMMGFNSLIPRRA